jgi:hypothetical protein
MRVSVADNKANANDSQYGFPKYHRVGPLQPYECDSKNVEKAPLQGLRSTKNGQKTLSKPGLLTAEVSRLKREFRAQNRALSVKSG